VKLFPDWLVPVTFAAMALIALMWLALCAQSFKTGLRGWIGKQALQISALLLFWGLLCGMGTDALFLAAVPPMAIVFTYKVAMFELLLTALAPFGLAAAGLTGALALMHRGLRPWAMGLAAGAGLCTAILAAGPVTSARLCATAEARGVSEIRLNSFLFNLRNASPAFQTNLHALIFIEGAPWGWSYREMDWYRVPSEAYANVTPPQGRLTCTGG
jgi:hypothetical protein